MSYDPTKRYVWSPDEKIEINGKDFAVIVNAVRSVLNHPLAPAILMADKANSALDVVMAKCLDQGKIRPADEPKPMMKIADEDNDSEVRNQDDKG